MRLKIPYHHQKTSYTCGPASLEMVFDYFRKHLTEKKIAKIAGANPKTGTKRLAMIGAATKSGFFCYVNNRSSLHEIKHFLETGLPVIVDFMEPSSNDSHYAVVSGFNRGGLILNDPWNGTGFRMKNGDFIRRWHDSINHSERWIMVIATVNLEIGRQYAPKKIPQK